MGSRSHTAPWVGRIYYYVLRFQSRCSFVRSSDGGGGGVGDAGDAEVRLRVRHSLFSWQNQQLRAEGGRERVRQKRRVSERRRPPSVPPSLRLPVPSLHISPITKPRRIPTTATPISPTRRRQRRRRRGEGGGGGTTGKLRLSRDQMRPTDSLQGFPVNSGDFCMTNLAAHERPQESTQS